MARISLRRKGKLDLKKLEKKVDALSEAISSFEKNIERMDSKINKLIESIESNGVRTQKNIFPVKLSKYRAKTERFGERTELSERPLVDLSKDNLNRIRGRHREILAMLINNGFHTYKQIAEKLNISQSRARAYIAELKNIYNVPLRHVRDPEGYKVGIDVRFVEEIILSK